MIVCYFIHIIFASCLIHNEIFDNLRQRTARVTDSQATGREHLLVITFYFQIRTIKYLSRRGRGRKEALPNII